MSWQQQNPPKPQPLGNPAPLWDDVPPPYGEPKKQVATATYQAKRTFDPNEGLVKVVGEFDRSRPEEGDFKKLTLAIKQFTKGKRTNYYVEARGWASQDGQEWVSKSSVTIRRAEVERFGQCLNEAFAWIDDNSGAPPR